MTKDESRYWPIYANRKGYDIFIEWTSDENYHVWECKIVKSNLSRDEAYAHAQKMIEEME